MSRTFHPRRKRRADDGRFLPKDAAAWRRLIRLARQAGRNPRKFAEGLGAAASACTRAVPPPGHAVRDSVFLRLIAKANAAWSSRGEARAAAIAELEPLAEACAAVLDGPPVAVRRRADIDDVDLDD